MASQESPEPVRDSQTRPGRYVRPVKCKTGARKFFTSIDNCVKYDNMRLVGCVKDKNIWGIAMGIIASIANNAKQYTLVAAAGMGLTGGRAPAGPLNAQIGISDPCNHKCVFCWDHPPEDRANEQTDGRFGLDRPGLMSFEQFKGVVDDLYRLGTRRIDLIGRGEPLNNRSALDMIRYVKARDIEMSLCTNGSRLLPVIADALVSTGVDILNVSLNAGSPESYPRNHVTERPENYLKVKQNLRYLADQKIAANAARPFVGLSFVISSQNYFEVGKMIDVAHEVGANEVQFAHVVVHEGTPDLALSEEQYAELLAALPPAREKAELYGIKNNLKRFEATVPAYIKEEVVGPLVVPCYVGWYFTLILANGSVLPCCQCAKPVDKISDERGFSEVWASSSYDKFRQAAKSLPEKNNILATCECDRCQMRPRNLAIHNFLHPFEKIEAGEEVQRFSLKDFVLKMLGRHGIA